MGEVEIPGLGEQPVVRDHREVRVSGPSESMELTRPDTPESKVNHIQDWKDTHGESDARSLLKPVWCGV